MSGCCIIGLFLEKVQGESAGKQKGSLSKEANGYYPHANKYKLHIIPKSSILYRCTIIQTKQD